VKSPRRHDSRPSLTNAISRSLTGIAHVADERAVPSRQRMGKSARGGYGGAVTEARVVQAFR
jgi:hypothetical protein